MIFNYPLLSGGQTLLYPIQLASAPLFHPLNESILTLFVRMDSPHTIRIYHKCEGRIEKSIPRITVWHHEYPQHMFRLRNKLIFDYTLLHGGGGGGEGAGEPLYKWSALYQISAGTQQNKLPILNDFSVWKISSFIYFFCLHALLSLDDQDFHQQTRKIPFVLINCHYHENNG